MIRQLKFLGGLLLAAGLAACGGGGGSAGTTTGSTGGSSATTPVPAAIEVFTSAPELTSAANSSVSFTVVVKDTNNQAMPNQTVSFTASSGNLIGSLPIPAMGAAGEAITTVGLSPGEDRSNRTIDVTLTSGPVTRKVPVSVVGTTVGISGDSSLLLSATTTYTVRALDSAGKPIANAALSVKSSLNNPLTTSTVTLGSTGAGTFGYRGTTAGLDTLTVTGLGATATTTVSVSADVFQFVSPTASTTVAVNTTRTATVSFQRNGAAVAGQTVTFSTTRGSVSPASAVTNAQGQASTVIASGSSGPANIVAQVPSSQVSLPISYIATVPASVIVQSNPGALPPNPAGSTTNQAIIQSTVRDASGNPVAGQVVNFTLVTDGSNGVITPGSATTDASGIAQTQFVPGSRSTGNNGVEIRGTVAGTTISGSTSVTVNTQALFISIATSNVLGNLDPQTYQKEFSVYVTDANGTPAGNRVINLEVFPTRYWKGQHFYSETDSLWVQALSIPADPGCANEDLNRNGILDAGEDVNGNGRLEPGLPIVVSPASVTTANNGFATFKLQYGENYANWVESLITARTNVGGTESVKSVTFNLQPLLSDMSDKADIANRVSPFGTGTSCTDPR